MNNMSYPSIKEYYETLRDSYILARKEEKNVRFKRELGYRFRSLIIVLFILTFSQIIPLSILSLLPESYKIIPFYKLKIPTIIPINIIILSILKLLHYLNKEHLVDAGIKHKKEEKRIGPLQEAFSALFTCLIKLKAYSETNDYSQLKEAKEHFFHFEFMHPYELFFEDRYFIDSTNSIFLKEYRETHLPWFNLSREQIDNIETFRYFLQQSEHRIHSRKQINDIIPSLEALSFVYYSAIKNKDFIIQNFIQFKQKAKEIPSFQLPAELPQVRIKQKIGEFLEKVQKNYLLYFAISFITHLVIVFVVVYVPCRVFFDVDPKVLAPIVFATAITLAFMDTNKNVKTNLNRKETKEK